MTMAKRKQRIKVYGSYIFRTKDPVIDELRTMAQDANAGVINYRVLRQIESNGGPSVSSMANWFFGGTMRPQSAATEAMGRALGKKRVWADMTPRELKKVKPYRNGHRK